MKRIALALLACLLAATVGAAPANPNHAGAQVGFWASQTLQPCATSTDPAYCPRDLSSYTPAVWKVLAETKGALYINMVYTSDFGPTPAGQKPRTDGLALIRHADALNIPVSAWITAPLNGGTFANENNAALMDRAVKTFHSWSIQQHLKIHEVDLDLEFPLGDQPLAQAAAGDLSGIESLMKANIDPAHQCRAIASYADTIRWAHAHGMRIAGTPVPFALDDLKDGHLALGDALDITAFPPGYDEWYLQAYRSYSNPGPGYVATYYRDMQHYFGARGQISLGGTGQPPYDKVANLVQDVRMLAGLGATAIPIFDLDGTVRTFGADGLRAVIEAGRHPLTGAALAAASKDDAYSDQNRQFFEHLDSVATALTQVVTTAEGHPRAPNAYPNGCGR
jgi:hypothetical protein